jgi:TPR repeat protein
MYAVGNGVPKDTHEAERWYKRAVDMESAGARAGWLMAQVYLANAYLQAKGVPLAYGEAMHWMRKAAENGYRQAQVNLGSMYRDGQGTPKIAKLCIGTVKRLTRDCGGRMVDRPTLFSRQRSEPRLHGSSDVV